MTTPEPPQHPDDTTYTSLVRDMIAAVRAPQPFEDSGTMYRPDVLTYVATARLLADLLAVLVPPAPPGRPPRPGDPAEPRLAVGMLTYQVWTLAINEQPQLTMTWPQGWNELHPSQQEVAMRIGAALFEAGLRAGDLARERRCGSG